MPTSSQGGPVQPTELQNHFRKQIKRKKLEVEVEGHLVSFHTMRDLSLEELRIMSGYLGVKGVRRDDETS